MPFVAERIEVLPNIVLLRGQWGLQGTDFVVACPMCGQEFTADASALELDIGTETAKQLIKLGCGFEGHLKNGLWYPT